MKTILVLVLSLAASTASATDLGQYCVPMGQLADGVMSARQRGVSLERSLTLSQEIKQVDVRNLTTGFVIEAYQTPIGDTVDEREEAVESFKNTIMLVCAERSLRD